MATALEQQLAEEGQSFEQYAREAFARIGARANMWLSLQASAARFGVTPDQVLGAALVARHRAADELAAKVGAAIVGLDDGSCELVPVRIGKHGKVFLAVRAVNGELGIWPMVLRVLTIAAYGVLATGTWKLGDAWLEVKKADATATALQADTAHKIATLAGQTTDPAMRQALAEAAAEASQAASSGGVTWVDQLMRGLGAAAAVGGSGALLWFGLAWLWSRGRASKRRRAAA